MNKEKLHESWKHLPHPIRWVVVATIGGTLLGLGVIFLVIPGPGLPLVVAGLAVLASEFAWAQYMLGKLKEKGAAVSKSAKTALKRNRHAE